MKELDFVPKWNKAVSAIWQNVAMNRVRAKIVLVVQAGITFRVLSARDVILFPYAAALTTKMGFILCDYRTMPFPRHERIQP